MIDGGRGAFRFNPESVCQGASRPAAWFTGEPETAPLRANEAYCGHGFGRSHSGRKSNGNSF